ncbi:SHOCT domain-containing protein [Clostridioides sp. ES-S-0048-02]|uniref:SHOCT domain-containing protein n=1 Tax=Clostridioides sp. ES-S-0048-02 TaxID=2770777 RepID=UPI001D12407B|nr:SHOCT domain-containing protein [Clostridioides sp. ES-S-0048-02]
MGLFGKKNKKPCCICGSEKGLIPSIEGENFCTACNCKYIDFSEKILKVTSIMKMMADSEGMKKFIEIEKNNMKLLDKFNETKNINSSVSFDEEQNLLKISYKNRNQILVEKIIKFDDILEFELLEDGETIVKGGLGRAITGGVLFGGTGAVVGGITGKKTSRKVVEVFKIKITLKDINNPIEYINLINSKVKTNSSIYQKAFSDAQEILSILSIITKYNVTEDKKEESMCNSTADEILKYKNLLDMEAITQEEFDAKKKELLNL